MAKLTLTIYDIVTQEGTATNPEMKSDISLSIGDGDVEGTISKEIPTLGVCLGHQAICQAYGAQIVHAKRLMHGKQSTAELDTQSPLFCGLPQQTLVARYHSLAADGLPQCLKVTARTTDGEVMAVQHRQYPIFGVQFHPESILTPLGKQMLENFIKL